MCIFGLEKTALKLFFFFISSVLNNETSLSMFPAWFLNENNDASEDNDADSNTSNTYTTHYI